ncbi:hypothetical protein [Allosphingosinicella sp.]|uniref:hypothetical protein n=1 Tax=Allosphingosinicella sp. TaxID=2823234 RepID=UPI003783EE41
MRYLLPLVLLLTACSGGGGNMNNQAINVVGPVTPAPPRVPAGNGPCVAPLEPGAEANCDFGEQERMSGVWVRGFEQSNFLPGDTQIPEMGYARRDHFWLTFADGVELDPAFRADFDKVQGTASAAVEFVGRRARAPGASPVVIVDRIISMRVLGAVGAR